MFLFCFQNLYYPKLIEEVQLHGMKINEIPQELHTIEQIKNRNNKKSQKFLTKGLQKNIKTNQFFLFNKMQKYQAPVNSSFLGSLH